MPGTTPGRGARWRRDQRRRQPRRSARSAWGHAYDGLV